MMTGCNGVRSGSGHSPSISKYCCRNSGSRPSHCSRLEMPSRNFASRRTASCLRKFWIMVCAALFMLVCSAAKDGDATRSVEAKQKGVFMGLGQIGARTVKSLSLFRRTNFKDSDHLLHLFMPGGISGQGCALKRGQQFIPDRIELGLHVGAAGCHGNHHIVLILSRASTKSRI